jgi:transposase
VVRCPENGRRATQRAAPLTTVSCDGAEWINRLVRQRVLQSMIRPDPFPVVAWALKAPAKARSCNLGEGCDR